MIDNDIETKLELMMLQLQRSALIDTQTLFRLMIDKGICTPEEIADVRDNIEYANPDVSRLDDQIKQLGGQNLLPLKHVPKGILLDQLKQLLSELNSQ